jgi:hypothetical protein
VAQVSCEGVAKYTKSHTGKAGVGGFEASRGNSILVKLIVAMYLPPHAIKFSSCPGLHLRIASTDCV